VGFVFLDLLFSIRYFVNLYLSFVFFWPLHCPSFFDLRFWLFLWYLLAIVLSVFLRLTASDYLFGIFWPLYCPSFFDLRLLITSLVSFGHCIVRLSSTYGFWLPLWYLLAIVLSVFLRLTASDYLFGIFWPLYCPSFFDLRLLIISLVSSNFSPQGTFIVKDYKVK
jgi:hypothetical protein